MHMNTRLFFAGLAVMAVPTFAACGGGIDVGAGKFTAFRVAAVGTPTASGDCNTNPNHTTTFRAGSTFLLYGVSGTAADQLFLDTGKAVLEGAKQDDGSFVFKGNTTDTMMAGNNTTITSKSDITVSFKPDGKAITGTTIDAESSLCAGTCGNFNGGACTLTSAFAGVEVEDPDAPPP